MKLLVVRLGTALGYLFVTALVYLAGVFVSPAFAFLYRFLLLVPILALLQGLIALFRIRYVQDFDTEHPVKGQSIGYRLKVVNESFLSTGMVTIRFKSVHPDLRSDLSDQALVFGPHQTLDRRFQIRCPYRGIYTVGLEHLATRDLLGWLELSQTVYHRTFYVYPRIVDIAPRLAGGRSFGLSSLTRAGQDDDFALVEGLGEYRSGLPVRHLAWKKYFATGRPFLKEFAKSAEPGITIYLDLRRERPPDTRQLEAEDCSIEISVAIVKYFLDNDIPIQVKAMGAELYTFTGASAEDFQAFYLHTINLVFQKSASPVDVFEDDRKRSAVDGSVLFVTHLPDPEVLSLVELSRDGSVGAVFNSSAMSSEERARLEGYRENLAGAKQRFFIVRSPETIREDLG